MINSLQLFQLNYILSTIHQLKNVQIKKISNSFGYVIQNKLVKIGILSYNRSKYQNSLQSRFYWRESNT